MDIQILGPDSRGMCYFYVPELPDVLVIANDCSIRTLYEKEANSHIILYCIRHNENYHVPKYFRTAEIRFLNGNIPPNWGWVGRGNYREDLRIMQPRGYNCWYKSGPLSDIPKNLSTLMEIYEKNTTSNSK
ncbi:MAG: hypothetical protein WC929_04880 [Bacilli bacterium]|jgi:hypothetical protein